MSMQFPNRVTVIGGGRMGVGIAHSFAAASEMLRDKVARGELGRKTGRGFYDWS